MTTEQGTPVSATKVCAACHVNKPLSAFTRNRRRKDGLLRICSPCNYAKTKLYRTAHPDYRRAKYHAGSKRSYQNRGLVARYGITLSEYEGILAKQGGGCAICGAKPKPNRLLDVDHDHLSGIVRGLVCLNCNLALGHIADDPDRALALMRYLIAFLKTFEDVPS